MTDAYRTISRLLRGNSFSTIGLFLFLSGFAFSIAQDVQQPSPSPQLSPSPSPTPTPTRTPSPTPSPGALNSHQWGSITVFNGLPSDSVRAIAQTRDGVMWFGTDNGLARFDGRRIQSYTPGGNGSKRVLVLEVDLKGDIWVGTADGAFVYSNYRFVPVKNTQGIGITTIQVGEPVLFGTDTGQIMRLSSTDSGDLAATNVLADPLRDADGSVLAITDLIEHEGRLLAATPGNGVFVIDGSLQTALPSKPRPLFVNSMVLYDNHLWLGTDAAKSMSGVYAFKDGSVVDRLAAPTADVAVITANENGVWAGTQRYGLFRFVERKLKKAYTFADTSGGLRSDTVYSLFTDREGVLWIGTNRGVSRFDVSGPFHENISEIPNSNFIRKLFRTRDGRIYAGSNRGLFVRSGEKWIAVAAYANRPIYSLGEDRAGNLLVGTATPVSDVGEDGIFRQSADGQREKIVDAQDVRDVYEDDKHDVWAATTTSGLLHARHDPELGWLTSSIGFEQGLPSDKAFSILPMDDCLLIATNRGVVKYRPGTVAPTLIPVRVLSQRVHDLAELGSKIDLDFPQNSILIEVAGQSSRTFPEEFQYLFTLTNTNGDIIERRLSNDAEYAPSELKPGEYRIEAVAFDRDLNRSDPLAMSFSIAKAPFSWTAATLAVLLLLAVGGLVWAFVEHRRLRQRNRELARARFDLANEAEQERRRIARDLHDQTLADLRNLMMMSDRTLPQNPEFRSEIEAVSQDIRRICEDLSPSVLENVGLVAALEFLLDRTIENAKFKAETDLEDRLKFSVHTQLQIYRIAQEVLTNIRAHSTANRVEMGLEMSANRDLILTIDDNGKSFEPDGTYKGRGIANIKARASLIKATVRWKPIATGNRFTLIIAA